MPEIAKAYVQIIPTTKGITNQLETEMGEAGEKSGKKFSGGLLGSIGKGVAVVGAAGAAATTALVASTSATADYADEIDKMSQKLGVSSTFYQEWDAVLQHSGTSMSSMTSTFKTLANASQDATADQQAAFAALGMSMDQVQQMSTEELFQSVIAGLQGMTEGTERAAIANDLLGRGSMELGALLNTSAEDTQGMIDTVHELGGVLSEDGVKAGAQFNDSLQDMQTAFAGLKNSVTTSFLPGMSMVMDGISGLVAGTDDGAANLSAGFSTIIEQLANSTSTILPTVMEVIGTLVTSVAEQLPTILPQLVTSVIDILISLIPDLIDAGFQLLTGIIGAMPEIIEHIVTALPEIITGIVNGLIENIPQIIEAGVQLLIALVTDLPTIIVEIAKAVPDIITGIIDAFVEAGPEIAEMGKNLLEGIWQGIQDAAAWLWEQVSGFFTGLISDVKGLLGIHSPSKVFAEIGGFMADGIGVGFDDEMDSVNKDIENAIQTDFSTTASITPAFASGGASGNSATFNLVLDGNVISTFFVDMMRKEVRMA